MKDLDKLCGYVYIIDFESVIKVGSSMNPAKRIKSIINYLKKYANKDAIGFQISKKHVNFRENEVYMHKLLSDYRIKDTELFKVDFQEAINLLNFLDYDTDFESAKRKCEEDSKKLIEMCKKFSKTDKKSVRDFFEEDNLHKEIKKYTKFIEILKLCDSYIYKSEIELEEFKNKYMEILVNY